MKKPKVALVHDYLVQYGGAERTLEAIAELFPDAPIYTSIYKKSNFTGTISTRNVITANSLDYLFKTIPILSKYFTFLTPLVFESFDLSDYDLVISDSSSYAKGVLTKPDQLHISYIHTPPRFLYGYSVENTKRTAWYYYPVVMVVDHFLRMWDFAAAQRPDHLVANSKEIKKRTRKYYGRESTIIYPPVDLAKEEDLNPRYKDNKEEYFLAAGRLVAYKNFDVVIKAFTHLPNLKLYVIGTGNQERELKKLAPANVKFLGRVSDEEKHHIMSRCLGLINTVQDEDFGIVPIEVLSHGRPVLAHRSAGHLETVKDGETGMLFDDLDEARLANKIRRFNEDIKQGKFKPQKMRAHAANFSKEKFKHKFNDFVTEKWRDHLDKVDKKLR